jgi:hypothetical protein
MSSVSLTLLCCSVPMTWPVLSGGEAQGRALPSSGRKREWSWSSALRLEVYTGFPNPLRHAWFTLVWMNLCSNLSELWHNSSDVFYTCLDYIMLAKRMFVRCTEMANSRAKGWWRTWVWGEGKVWMTLRRFPHGLSPALCSAQMFCFNHCLVLKSTTPSCFHLYLGTMWCWQLLQ